jgi:ABC-type histidine transport system ATPase subunit
VSGSGSGSGSGTFTVQPNTVTTARSGAILVSGNVITVSQDAGKPKPRAPTNLKVIKD